MNLLLNESTLIKECNVFFGKKISRPDYCRDIRGGGVLACGAKGFQFRPRSNKLYPPWALTSMVTWSGLIISCLSRRLHIVVNKMKVAH